MLETILHGYLSYVAFSEWTFDRRVISQYFLGPYLFLFIVVEVASNGPYFVDFSISPVITF